MMGRWCARASRLQTTSLLILGGIGLTACAQSSLRPVSWDELHGDMANSGQKFVTGPLLTPGAAVTDTDVDLSRAATELRTSPSVGPGGYIGISSFAGGATLEDNLSILYVLAGPNVVKAVTYDGQISTATIDGTGNIYAVRDPSGAGKWLLQSWNEVGAERWQSPLDENHWTLAPPKMIPDRGGPILVVPSGNSSLSFYSAGGALLKTVLACQHIVGGVQGFHVPGIGLRPYLEDPTVGILDDHTGTYYLAVPVNGCGVSFQKVYLGANPGEAPVVIPINASDDDTQFGSPVVAVDGTVLVPNTNKMVKAYDIRTGDQKWERELSRDYETARIALLPLALNFAYALGNSTLHKLDLEDGKDVATPRPILDPRGVVATANYVYVAARDGIYAFDFDLNLKGFRTLGSPPVSLAVGPAGELYVTDERLHLHILAAYPTP